jgi:acetolactate synthase-1/2/3 large subunit
MAELKAARISDESKKAFFEILRKSRRPLIYAGGGIVKGDAASELQCFAKMFNIPVVTTLQGIGSVDTTDPLSLGMLGMHGTAFANYSVEDCDFLIALGARFDDRVAGNVPKFAPNARNIAHIDIDAAEIGKVKHVTWSHVGDVRTGLNDLIAAGEGISIDTSQWLQHVWDLKKKHSMNYDRETPLIQPHYVLECLNELTQGEAIITTGVGQHQMWAAQWLDYKHPRTFLTSGSMGTMGFGLPAAIGAQFAYPDRLVIAIDGDGSLRMNLGEMETVTNYGLPLKIVLLNNQGDGMVRQWQKLFFSDRFCGTEKFLHRKDFIKSAEADGFYCAIRVTEKEGVKEGLRQFLEHDGPSFIEVMIDPDANVYPMVGPGMSYKAMVTGDHISKREETVEVQKGRDLF